MQTSLCNTQTMTSHYFITSHCNSCAAASTNRKHAHILYFIQVLVEASAGVCVTWRPRGRAGLWPARTPACQRPSSAAAASCRCRASRAAPACARLAGPVAPPGRYWTPDNSTAVKLNTWQHSRQTEHLKAGKGSQRNWHANWVLRTSCKMNSLFNDKLDTSINTESGNKYRVLLFHEDHETFV